MVRPGKAGEDWRGEVRHGLSRLGAAGRGVAGKAWMVEVWTG